MAGAFAPNAEFSIAQEQPVAGVENRAAEVAVRGIGSFFDSLSRTGGGSTKAPQPDPLMAEFLEQMEVIEAQRASGQSLKATMNERRLIANYVDAGGVLNEELKAIVKATTGRPFEYYGQTEQQRQFEAMTGTEEFRTAYISAQARFPGSTEEELMGIALSSIQDQAIAGDTLARSAAGEQLSWETRLSPAYTTIIDAFKGGAVAGLLEITAAGGTLTPDEVLQTRLKWDLVKNEITKPAHVTDAQWQGMQDKITKMDTMFETMTKLASSEHAIENLQSVLLSAAQAGDTSLTLEETIAVLAYVKDPAGIMQMAGSGMNPAVLLTKLMGRTEDGLRIEQDIRLGATIASSNQVSTDPMRPTIPDGNVVLNELPEEFKGYSGMDKGAVVSNLNASIATIGAITPQQINAGNGADQDLADAYQMAGAAMMGATSFLSADKIKEIVGSPDKINQNLAAIAGMDPEAAVEARVMLRSGLTSQLNMLQANEDEITRYHELRWDPAKRQYFIPGHKEHASDWAEWYSGTTDADGNFYMDNNQRGTIPKGWKDLMDRRAAIDAVNNGLSALALPEEQPTAEDITPESLEGASLVALETAATMLGWDENAGREKLTDFLRNNGQNIDPRETAWCAAFVNASLQSSGLDGTGRLNARSFLDWGEEVSEPQEGDIVVLSRGDNPAQGHVGFFKGFDANGNIMILGGNQGDAVSIKAFPASRLLGYRRATGEALPIDDPTVQRATTAVANLMSRNPLPLGTGKAPGEGDITTSVLPSTNQTPDMMGEGAAPQPQGAATDTGVPGADAGMTFDANIELGVPMDVVEAAAEQKSRSEQDTSGPDLSPYKPLSKSNLSEQRQRIIRNQLSYMGVAKADRDVPVFEDVDAAMDAIISGDIQMGDVIVIGDQVRVIEDQSGGSDGARPTFANDVISSGGARGGAISEEIAAFNNSPDRSNGRRVSPDEVIVVDSLDEWESGIKSGRFKVGDIVAYWNDKTNAYSLSPIRRYDVDTIRGR